MDRQWTRAIWAAAMMAMTAPAASAQTPPACSAEAKPALPAALAGWATPAPLAAATDRDGVARATLVPGKAATVTLLPTPTVHYPLQPEKPGGSVSHGGLLAFPIARAGGYRVALGSAAWIDVVRDGKAVVSTAHGHGPACSTIRKMVDFSLEPGDYVLQISANATAELTVLIAPLP
ncbi:homogentisate 1,2-dioxygenase [Sphingomonas sp.]|uniref:homogentisate 1,2-dioxygenase n=1 Tax=Sphingomonas sp. TaxID=28214 RepID=UPI00257D7852|nr:homogentisate 1,2-dioxygenase [Sphingomonas sp.]